MSAIRVLLADDEEEFRLAVSKVLRRRGMQVVCCSDGDEALRTAAAEPFDVFVLDVKMPGRNGIACLSELRQLAPEVPAILMTGHLAPEDERDGLSAGAFAYLLKPHPLPDLVAKIEAAARARRES